MVVSKAAIRHLATFEGSRPSHAMQRIDSFSTELSAKCIRNSTRIADLEALRRGHPHHGLREARREAAQEVDLRRAHSDRSRNKATAAQYSQQGLEHSGASSLFLVVNRCSRVH